MTSLTQDSFKVSINVLRFFGLYPSNNNSVLAKVKGVLFYLLSNVLVSILIFISLLSDNDYDNVEMNFSVILLCETVAFMFKNLPLLLDGRRIMNCVNYLEGTDFAPFGPEEKKITDECVYICYRNSTANFYGILGSALAWTGLQVRSRRFPINCWLPYDAATNLFVYYLTWIYLFAGILLQLYCENCIILLQCSSMML